MSACAALFRSLGVFRATLSQRGGLGGETN